MKKLPAPKVTILMVVLVLLGSSMACRIFEIARLVGEVADQSCSPISREEYEYYAERLGETPKTPKYPESAVYEVCEIKNIHDEWEVVSVRMSEGYRDEDENGEPAQSDKTIAIHAGTYVGKTGVYGGVNDYEIREDKLVVIIDDEGRISGSYTFEHITPVHTKQDGCSLQYHFAHSGTFSGQLIDDHGLCEFTTITNVCKQLGTCSATVECDESTQGQVFIELIDGNIEGRWLDDDIQIQFTAIKQE